MKKEEFFNELKIKLSVIEETELEDILSEYRQHIDMKMKTEGVTEEEAIADFGSVSQLATEILEAYHVRTDFSKVNKAQKTAEMKEKCRETTDAVVDGVSDVIGDVSSAIKSGWKKFVFVIKSFFQKIKTFFACSKNQPTQEEPVKDQTTEDTVPNIETFDTKKSETKPPEPQKQKIKKPKRKGVFMAMIINSCNFIGRLIWNLFFGFLAIMFGIALCVCLVSFGFFLVNVGSYPILGLTIGSFGCSLMFFAATWFFVSILKRKNKSAKQPQCENNSKIENLPNTEEQPQTDLKMNEEVLKEEIENDKE